MSLLTFDLRMLHASGIGRYLTNLVPRLLDSGGDRSYRMICDTDEVRGRGYEWSSRAGVELSDCRAPIYSIAEQLAIPRKIAAGTDLYWSPHYNIPLGYRGRMLVTIHDVLHLARPEFVEGFHRKAYASLMVRAAVRRASLVLCDSHFTADETVRLTGLDRGKIRVIYPGVDGSWFDLRRGERPINNPFLLYVGNLKPHKNLQTLVEAFALLAGRIPHDLVIVGREEGFLTGDPKVRPAAAKLGSRVRFTGAIGDDLLHQYLLHADLLVHPSLYEGFGLPPLEAMACGCPVVVSREASIPEVCGDAALYCEARDPVDMSRRILEVLDSETLRAELIEKGRERAKEFTWERCARETGEAIDEILAG
jgi:glycosyltransferase involved in cell wall biosynthesis